MPFYDSVDALQSTVPGWIGRSIKTKRRVTIPGTVQTQIRVLAESGKLQFYDASAADAVQACIREVLERDIRSLHKSKLAYDGRESSQQIDNLNITYRISTDKWCEIVHVNKVELI